MSDGEFQRPHYDPDEVEDKFFAKLVNIEIPKKIKPMTGVDLIAQERLEQKIKHGHSINDDVTKNKDSQLADAAQALIEGDPSWFPKDWDSDTCTNMIEKSYKERLIYAGAMIAAEHDRLNFKE